MPHSIHWSLGYLTKAGSSDAVGKRVTVLKLTRYPAAANRKNLTDKTVG